jgi:hypothetical protein
VVEESGVQLQLIQQFKQALTHFNIKEVGVFLLPKANKTYRYQIFKTVNKNSIEEEEAFQKESTQQLKKLIKNVLLNKDLSTLFNKI